MTIFGQSAGGMSVSEHLISPMTAGLFDQAISHSGPIINAFSLHVSESRLDYFLYSNDYECDNAR